MGKKGWKLVKTDDHDGREGSAGEDASAKVVRLPREWRGPPRRISFRDPADERADEPQPPEATPATPPDAPRPTLVEWLNTVGELVPLERGGRIDQGVSRIGEDDAERGEGRRPPEIASAGDFWGEDAATLHDPVALPGQRSATQLGPSGPAEQRPDASAETFAGARGTGDEHRQGWRSSLPSTAHRPPARGAHPRLRRFTAAAAGFLAVTGGAFGLRAMAFAPPRAGHGAAHTRPPGLSHPAPISTAKLEAALPRVLERLAGAPASAGDKHRGRASAEKHRHRRKARPGSSGSAAHAGAIPVSYLRGTTPSAARSSNPSPSGPTASTTYLAQAGASPGTSSSTSSRSAYSSAAPAASTRSSGTARSDSSQGSGPVGPGAPFGPGTQGP